MTRERIFNSLRFRWPGLSLGALPSSRRAKLKCEGTTCLRNPALESFAGEFDRLSSLTMAAGKDFNDELTFILNYAEVSLDLLGPKHPASDGIVELTHAAMRCAETTRCLLLLTLRARESVRYDKVRDAHADPGNRELL